ncbi:MAG: type II toxin-antitoxin system YafQ family toxin [Clostridia bacterium]|nr:type II toxin-antitoxin system YafQ family toxin [Clostridia bacterium]
MLKIEYQGQFKKDFKIAIKRGCDISELQKVITLLAKEQPLPQKYRDHALINSKDYKNVRECHIEPDWLLIYKIDGDRLVLKLIRTGTHADLF